MASGWESLLPIIGAGVGQFVPGVGPIVGGLIGSGLGDVAGLFGPSIEEQMQQAETDAYNFANSQNMPYYNQILQSTLQPINTAFNKGQRDLVSNLAGSGLSKSGVGAAALNQLQGERGQAINQGTTQVNEQNLQWRMNLINRLLGMGETGVEMQNRNDLLSGQGMGQITGALLQRLLGGNMSSTSNYSKAFQNWDSNPNMSDIYQYSTDFNSNPLSY